MADQIQEIPVCIDPVGEAQEKDNEVRQGEGKHAYRNTHDPALQQWHWYVGGCHQNPY